MTQSVITTNQGGDEKTETIIIEGEVVSGLGEGAYYVGLDEYKTQFELKLGFEPYPGTLNIRLSEQSLDSRRRLDSIEGIAIKGFEKGNKTFGNVKCFKALIEDRVMGAVVIIDRTHYTASTLEVIAPVELRRRFRLKDGDKVKLGITVQKTGKTKYQSE